MKTVSSLSLGVVNNGYPDNLVDPNFLSQEFIDELELNEEGKVNCTLKNQSLVGKLLTPTTIKPLALTAIIRKVWKSDSVECHDLERNFFLFIFQTAEERLRVFSSKPWVMQDSLFILKEWQPEKALEEIDFSLEKFWVQVHNLPIGLITLENVRKISKLFPVYYGSSLDDGSNFYRFGSVSVRVAIMIEDPLKIGFILNRKKDKPLEIAFKYEGLPKFCFSCGRVGHVERECNKDTSLFKLSGRFGPCLRASFGEKPRKTILLNGKGGQNTAKEFHDEGETVACKTDKSLSFPKVGKSLGVSESTVPSCANPVVVVSMCQKVNIGLPGSATRQTGNCPSMGKGCMVPEPMHETTPIPNLNLQICPTPESKLLKLLGNNINNGSGNLLSNSPVRPKSGSSSLALEGPLSPWGSLLAEGLDRMEVSCNRKRKRDEETGEYFSKIQRRELWNKVEAIVQVAPGNWCLPEKGFAANEEVLRAALFPASIYNNSSIIQEIERKKKGKTFGTKRLTLIRKAARRKYSMECSRIMIDEAGLMELREDPFGKKITKMPSMCVNDDFILNKEVLISDAEEPAPTSSSTKAWVYDSDNSFESYSITP